MSHPPPSRPLLSAMTLSFQVGVMSISGAPRRMHTLSPPSPLITWKGPEQAGRSRSLMVSLSPRHCVPSQLFTAQLAPHPPWLRSTLPQSDIGELPGGHLLSAVITLILINLVLSAYFVLSTVLGLM